MKKVYRVVAVLLMCFCLVAAVAETAGSAVLREMNMMIPGEGNSVTVGTFYQILCENCKVVTSATTPSTSGAFLYRDEYYASAGNTVDVIFDPSAVPRDKYFLGSFLSDPQVTFNSPDGETFFFTMPAQDITVTAELANRETVTFDLTQKDTIDVDESAAQFLTEYAVEMLSVTYADPLLLDLNADGENDVQLTLAGSNSSMARLPGADKITSDITITCEHEELGYFWQFKSFTFKVVRAEEPSTLPTETAPPAPPATETTPPPADAAPAVGDTVTVNGLKYKITGADTATFIGLQKPKSLPAVTIPATIQVSSASFNVTAVADNALNKDTKVATVTLGKNIKKIGKNAFASCSRLKSVRGGAAVTAIGASAFQSCKALKTFQAMSKLQKIGKNAFKGAKVLAKFTLAKTVTNIGKNAFYGCAELKTITVRTEKLTSKNVGAGAFKGINRTATFKCPKKQLKNYKTLFVKKGAPKSCKFK